MAIDHEAILRRAHENMARTEEMLSEPRPVTTYEPPRHVKAYDVEQLEQMLDKRLLAIEARLSLRIDAIESNLASLWNGVEGFADEAGTALGEVERRVRDEYKNQIDALLSEVTLLRAQANTPQRRHKPALSRAPFKLEDENAFRN